MTLVRPSGCSAAVVWACWLALSVPSLAGTIRHDVADSEYTTLAALPDYASVGKLSGTLAGGEVWIGSAVLVKPGWALTSADLIDETGIAGVSFEVGGTTYAASSWLIHPNWIATPHNGYDLALVKLASTVTEVAPARLYQGTFDVGAVATVVGYGEAGTGASGQQPGTAGTRRAGQNTLDLATYNGTALRADFDDPGDADLHNPTGSATPLGLEFCLTRGDLGAGAFMDVDGSQTLVGIGSWMRTGGDRTNDASYSDVFEVTRVSVFGDWIEQEALTNWANPLGGAFADPTNWTAGVPTSDADARFGTTASYVVSFDRDATNTGVLVRGGEVTFDLRGHAYTLTGAAGISHSVIVGSTAGADAMLTVRDGTLSGCDGLVMGSGLGLAQVVVDDGGVWAVAGDLSIGAAMQGGGPGLVTVRPNGTLAVGGRTRVLGSGTLVMDAAGTLARLNLIGGTLRVNHSTELLSPTIDGGTIDGIGEVSFAGQGGGSRVTLGAPLEARVQPGARLALTNLSLQGGTLRNEGMLELGSDSTGGQLEAVSGHLTNAAGGELVLRGAFGGGKGGLLNDGALRKVGPGEASLTSWLFYNNGSLSVEQGSLRLGGGNNSGTFSVSPGSRLVFGANRFVVRDATALPANGLTVDGGDLNVQGDHTLGADFEWRQGVLSGPGTTVLPTGASMVLSGMLPRTLDGRTLENHGTLTLSGVSYSGSNIQARGSASIINRPGAVLDLQRQSFLGLERGTGLLLNQGTITKTLEQDASIHWLLDNQGRIDVVSGTLRIDGGGTSSGAIATAGDARVIFGSGKYAGPLFTVINPALLGGPIELDGGELWLEGDYVAEDFKLTRGILSGPGRTSVPAGAVMSAGGPISNSGDVSVAGHLSILPQGTLRMLSGKLLGAAGNLNAIENAGLILKAGAGSASLGNGLANSGTIDVQEGVLVLEAGRSTGLINVQAGATLAVREHTFAGAEFRNAGRIVLGNAEFLTDTRIPGETNSYATLRSGAILSLERFIWGGTLEGEGTYRIASGGQLALSPSSPLICLNARLENAGTFIWDTGAGILTQSSPLIANAPAATIDIRKDAYMAGRYSPSDRATLENAGLVRKSGGTGTTPLDVVFNNTGVVEVTSGTLALVGGGLSTGRLEVASGAALTLRGVSSPFDLQAGGVLLNGLLTADNVSIHGALQGPGRLGIAFATTADGIRLDSLEVDVDQQLSIRPGGGPAGSSKVRLFANNGTLDLADHDLIVTSGDLAAIEAQVTRPYQGSPGSRVISSLSSVAAMTRLGVLTNNDGQGSPLYATFGGLSTGLNDILVGYTWIGDADLSKGIDAADYAGLDVGMAGRLQGWGNGDFDYNGTVNFYDYALIDYVAISRGLPLGGPMYRLHEARFGSDYVAAMSALGVPEPSCGLLAVLGGAVLVARKRRIGR